MKISYRDKILLIIMVVILTGFLGYMFLIKPKTEDIETNKSKYSVAEEKQSEINNKISKLPSIKKQVSEYEVKNTTITNRFLKHSRDFDVDRFVQDMLDNNQLVLVKLDISDLEIVDLKPYVYSPVTISYPLYNGRSATYSDDVENDTQNQTYVSGYTPLPAYTIDLDFVGNQVSVEDFFNGLCVKAQMSIVVEEYTSDINNEGITIGNIKFKIFFLEPKELQN